MQPATCSGRMQVGAHVSASPAIDDVLPALCARLRSRFGGVLYRHRIPAEDAEDLVQTVLLLAVAKWDNIRDPEAWLIGTLRKRCILYWRTRRSHMEYTRPFEELDRECGVEPDPTRRDRFADLGKVWHLLPLTQRKLLVLRFQEGMSPREAAQAVGLAYTSVRKITNRAFERLREALGTTPPSRSACGQRAPRLPAGSGRAVPPPAGLREITVPKAARPAISLERERLVPEMLATPIPVVAPSRGRPLAPKEPSAAPVVQAGGKAGSAHTSRGDPSGRTRRIPDRAPPLPAAARPFGRARLNGPLAQPKRAARPCRVSALWKAEIEAYLASFASTDHETYRRLLDAASALAGIDLPQLTVAHLTAYRERLRADGRGQRVHLQALSVLRAFLVWAGARHSHQLGAWEVVAALPLPPIADEDFTRAFVAHFREGLAAGRGTHGGRA